MFRFLITDSRYFNTSMDSFQSLLALRNQHPNAIALWVLVGKQVKIEARVPVMPSKAATKSEKDNIANCCGPVMPMGRVWVGTCGEWEDRKRKGGERKGGEKEKQRNKETKKQRNKETKRQQRNPFNVSTTDQTTDQPTTDCLCYNLPPWYCHLLLNPICRD